MQGHKRKKPNLPLASSPSEPTSGAKKELATLTGGCRADITLHIVQVQQSRPPPNPTKHRYLGQELGALCFMATAPSPLYHLLKYLHGPCPAASTSAHRANRRFPAIHCNKRGLSRSLPFSKAASQSTETWTSCAFGSVSFSPPHVYVAGADLFAHLLSRN